MVNSSKLNCCENFFPSYMVCTFCYLSGFCLHTTIYWNIFNWRWSEFICILH